MTTGRWMRSAGLTLALVGWAAAPAWAQEETVKPYVMLLFDTSGSMLWDVCAPATTQTQNYQRTHGDNSSECPGNDVACSACNTIGCGNTIKDDTRLYKVKQGASSVVSAFGEVTFALARFHQTPNVFTCDTPNYSRAGGWMGAYGTAIYKNDEWACIAGGSVNMMGSGDNQADILVGFGPTNQTQILRWMNHCDDYPTPGACPASLAPQSGCSSLCPDCGSGCDYEIRGSGNTPLAGSLYDLRTSFFPTVLNVDAKKACRPYKVILLTDGQNNCYGDPVQQANLLYTNNAKSVPVHVIGFGSSGLKPYLDQIAGGGGTGSAVVVDNEVSLALAMANIISESILKEKCNTIDDDCDDLCDENWPEVAVTGAPCTNKHAAQTCTAGVGICLRTGVYACKADGSGSECNVQPGPPAPGGEICNNSLDDDCDGAIDEGCLPCVPQPEICDGKDNNCNGQIDEGYVSAPCGSNIGECKAGTTLCQNGKVVCNGSKPPESEACDGKDNNCDTIVDNFSETCYPPPSGCDLKAGTCKGVCAIGMRLCSANVWGACVGWNGPGPEICNGLDDDCDGIVDNVAGAGQACGKTLGECKAGKTACVQQAGGGWAVICQGETGPGTEVCDDKDNDCDGLVDEDFPEKGKLCGGTVGLCKAGTWACQNGALVCAGGQGPVPEKCDGEDNDCNGAIDDNVPGMGQPCGIEAKGECKPGLTACVGGKVICAGGQGAQPEVCDGKDNDCDGAVDQNAECPDGSKCVEGACVVPCGTGEFNCPGGTNCVNGWCMPDKCAKVSCPPTQRCLGGSCVEKCSGVLCPEHEKCDPLSGKCVDDSCYSKGCPTGEACVGYQCVKSPCPPGTCRPDQMCLEGKCYDTCLNVTCKDSEVCVQGTCVKKSACDGVPCDSGLMCKVVNGAPQCVPDPCRAMTCPRGQACKDGSCVADPCATATCPEALRCQQSAAGLPECVPIPGVALPSTTQLVAAGGGGCSCRSAGDAPAAGLWPLLMPLLLLRRRRRPERR